MRNFKYSGASIPFVATEEVKSGQPYILGSFFGVVSNSLKVGQDGELFVTGVWELPNGSPQVELGQKLYFDTKTKTLVVSKDSEAIPAHLKLVGAAVEGSNKSTVICRLNGVAI